MSHVDKMNIDVKNLKTLDRACKELGLELVLGQKKYKWYGRSYGESKNLPVGFTQKDLGKCDHVIRIPNDKKAYEIGIAAKRDGNEGYELLWDTFNSRMVNAVGGKGAGRLIQMYSIETATQQAYDDGFAVTRYNLPDGSIHLEVMP